MVNTNSDSLNCMLICSVTVTNRSVDVHHRHTILALSRLEMENRSDDGTGCIVDVYCEVATENGVRNKLLYFASERNLNWNEFA